MARFEVVIPGQEEPLVFNREHDDPEQFAQEIKPVLDQKFGQLQQAAAQLWGGASPLEDAPMVNSSPAALAQAATVQDPESRALLNQALRYYDPLSNNYDEDPIGNFIKDITPLVGETRAGRDYGVYANQARENWEKGNYLDALSSGLTALSSAIGAAPLVGTAVKAAGALPMMAGMTGGPKARTFSEGVLGKMAGMETDAQPWQQTRADYQAVTLDPRETFEVAGQEVIRNPTPADYKRLSGDVRQRYDVWTPGEPTTRKTLDAQGNEYIWRAPDAVHATIEPELGKLLGGRALNQNRPLENHRRAVFEALKRGEEVPDNVLADYPEFLDPASRAAYGLPSSPAPADDRTLALVHNLTSDNLRHANELGGLPVPSLAVVKGDEGFDSFGDITLVGDKRMATPSASNPFYSTDAYSPRYPRIYYTYNNQAVRKLEERAEQSAEAVGDYAGNVSVALQDGKPLDRLAETPAMIKMYLDDIGEETGVLYMEPKRTAVDARPELKRFVGTPEPELIKDPDFQREYSAYKMELVKAREKLTGPLDAEDLARKTKADPKDPVFQAFATDVSRYSPPIREIDPYGTRDALRARVQGDQDYARWVKDQFEGLSPKGRIYAGTDSRGAQKYIPATPKNIVKVMKGDPRGGEGQGFGLTKYRAQITPRFKNFDEMKAAEDRLVSAEEMKGIAQNFDTEFKGIHEELLKYDAYPDAWGDQGNTMDKLVDIVAGRETFEDFYPDAPAALRGRVEDFNTRLRGAPSAYFEGKPQRMVGLEEFKGAIVPEAAGDDIVEILKGRGVGDVYKYASPEERVQLLQKFRDQMFNLAPFVGAGFLGYNAIQDDGETPGI